MTEARLILICGLPGSGKTTLATQHAPNVPAVRLCPDEWKHDLGIDYYDEQARVDWRSGSGCSPKSYSGSARASSWRTCRPVAACHRRFVCPRAASAARHDEASLRLINADGRAALLVGDEVFDLEQISGGTVSADPMTCVAKQWDAVTELSSRGAIDAGTPFNAVHLRAPVPTPSAIFGLVANYPPAERTVLPMVFSKAPSSLVGPYDDIVLPDADRLPMRNEWTVPEAELALVVGRGGRHIDPENALDALAGFAVAQDVTERVHEFGPRGTSVGSMDYASLKTLGKSMDTFCPLGPALVTLDELDDPNDLQIECRLNGETVQKSTTREMLADVTELVVLLSTFVSLRPGDICLTGTPTPLVGGALPRLQPGDVVETEISGLGLLRNRCIRE